MECPNCKHATSNTALLQCSHCGESFERGLLEELGHIDYLQKWVDEHRADIGEYQAGIIQGRVGERQRKLLKELKGNVEVPQAASIPVVKEEHPDPVPLPTLVVIPAPTGVKPTQEKPTPVAGKAQAKQMAAPIPVARPAPVAARKPKPAPKPAAPPKPKRPPIDWRKVITEAATSGALLRALLYLGAFMIVVSATVLVIRFWDQFHPIIQLLFISSLPLSFYIGGWALRIRLKLLQAGTVLTGIGALLVVVDFGAIYQLGGVGQNNGPLYWLLVTIFCTALYAYTAWRLKGEFFDYLPLLGGASVLFTFTRFLRLPTEWSVVSVTIAGAMMTMLAGRYYKSTDHWRDLARAARYLSQILIPSSVFYIIFSPGIPPVGQMIGFLFATMGYFVLAWHFPALIFAYAALGASIGTVVFALRVAELPIEWYATVASVLALAYILIGQRVQKAKFEPNIIQKYITALNTTGLILVGLAAIGGFVFAFENNVWPGVIAMTLASLDLAIFAYLFGKSRYTMFAAGLFIVPFSIAILRWFHDLQMQASPGIAWISFAWSALALSYILLAAVLHTAEKHNKWLHAWGHGVTSIALFLLPFAFVLDAKNWTSFPTLVSLGAAILVYVLSFILQDSGRHSSLSGISKWLPYGLGKSIFLWPVGLLLPVWVSVAWHGADFMNASSPWLGTVLTGLGLAYIGLGQWLFKRAKEYRLPFHVYTYLLCIVGVLISAADTYAFLTTLLITVISIAVMAYLYNRVVETIIASLLFVWPFQLALDIFNVPFYAQNLGFVLLASLVYIPVATYLNKSRKSREKFHHLPVFIVGYVLVAYTVAETILLRGDVDYISWIGVAVPLIATALFTFSASYFKAAKYSSAWAWAGTLTFTIAFGQALTLFKVPFAYDALAWAVLAAFYMISERMLFFTSQKETNQIHKFWSGLFHLPFIIFALALAALGLALSLLETLNAFVQPANYLPLILAQSAVVLLAIASARLYRQSWQFFIEPFIAFLPATLFFIGYGKQIFGQSLATPQYALIWSGLGIIHVLAGIFVDRAKIRYSHGLYLGGYVLISWAVLWSIFDRSTLVWTLGLGILTSIASALLVHFRRHQTWDDFLGLLFGTSKGIIQSVAQNAFQWLAAWTFPIWCVIFLREVHVSDSFSGLGLVFPPLAYLGLALWFRRVDVTYTTPLFSAAQFFTILGLLISMPTTIDYLVDTIGNKNTLLAFIILQCVAVIFYSFCAWIFKSRGFIHASAWLSIIPFTMAWKLYGIALTPISLVVPWLIWSALLLVIGFALDKNKVRYAHGPYLAGYMLAAYALAVSTPDRLSNIYALGITILLAVISYIVLHFGRHDSYEDFINTVWQKANATTQQIVSTFFLFFAAYAVPVLITQILAHIDTPLAWRGVALAVAAPLYIAISLLIRNAKPRSALTLIPTWALYSAGYALTAIGAIVASEDELLGTYVLALNTIVYAVSAYIFQQAFWLYLSTLLTPIIALLVLHQTNRLDDSWIAWIFIAFAYIYLAIGQIFDRARSRCSLTPTIDNIHPFAVPFYMPGFLLSIIALAVASSEKTLAIQIYSAGVILYALSGWLLRETLFIYPAAWLAAVPYYLVITLTPLETRWYGLVWLPLIISYIAIGRAFFHKQPLARLGRGALVQWLTHPAIPFYLLAYALSVSMISLSYISPLATTIAFAAAAILYMASAFLFRTPAWIYASLFAAHMVLLSYFTINPQGGEAYRLSYPFHVLTWLMALLGYGFSRWITVANSKSESEANQFVKHLLGHVWARPFFLFAVIDIVIWQSIALNGFETTVTLAIGHALLFTLFSILWMEGMLVYGVVGFSLLAVGASLKQAEVPFADAVAVFGGIGFGLYLLARVLDPITTRFKSLTVWLAPLIHSSIFLTATAVIINLPLVATHMTANAASLAFAGALYITIAYRGRQYVLGYLGMALLEIAWALVLYASDISQPQLYAIPGGLYFMGIAYLEMHQNRKGYAIAIEMLGLGILLVTSFAQSLNGEAGLAYFVLLLLESLLVIWWGVLQKRKIPFFAGISATVINIAAQVIVLIAVHDIHRVNRWVVAFGAGLLITGIAVFAELKREQLRARSRQLSEMLEAWD
jgi:hypothetical protein